MKVLETMEVEQVVGAGGYVTDFIGSTLGQINIALDQTLGNAVGQTVQNTEIDVANLLGSLITF